MSEASEAPPPAPWRLKGEMLLSAWLVREGELDPTMPPGWRPLRIAGRLLVGALWARYDAGGTLAYREFAVGVLLHRGLRLGVTVPWIWVDSERSLEGGRRLWSIPKRLAHFQTQRGRSSAGSVADAEGEVARLQVTPAKMAWPRLAMWIAIAQPDVGQLLVARSRLSGTPRLAKADWRMRAPLGALAGRPLLSLALAEAQLVVGPAVSAPAMELRRALPPGSPAAPPGLPH